MICEAAPSDRERSEWGWRVDGHCKVAVAELGIAVSGELDIGHSSVWRRTCSCWLRMIDEIAFQSPKYAGWWQLAHKWPDVTLQSARAHIYGLRGSHGCLFVLITTPLGQALAAWNCLPFRPAWKACQRGFQSS